MLYWIFSIYFSGCSETRCRRVRDSTRSPRTSLSLGRCETLTIWQNVFLFNHAGSLFVSGSPWGVLGTVVLCCCWKPNKGRQNNKLVEKWKQRSTHGEREISGGYENYPRDIWAEGNTFLEAWAHLFQCSLWCKTRIFSHTWDFCLHLVFMFIHLEKHQSIYVGQTLGSVGIYSRMLHFLDYDD